ncbi:MAG: S1 RNA-binding domain-containing protein [Polyangiaceae bacterium]|nr:S1 RNA-binding domain-containing protein [Polyangiaceae bacterium]
MSQTDQFDPTAPQSADSTPKPSGASEGASSSDHPETSTPNAPDELVAEGAGGVAAASNAEAVEPSETSSGAEANAAETPDANAADATNATGEAAEGVEGAPHKRKRRRRHKKKAADGTANAANAASAINATSEGAPLPADGSAEAATNAVAPGEGTEGTARGRKSKHDKHEKQDKKDRPERERPAFNVGDVVFGKVIEFTEDALFVDLAGKAKAIFDLRELLITEDEAEEYNRAHTAERKEAEEARKAAAEHTSAPALATSGLPEAVEATEATTKEESGGAAEAAAQATQVEAVPEDVQGAPVAPPAAETTPVVVEGEAAEASTEAPTEQAEQKEPTEPTEKVEQAEHEKAPQLPHVILEPGAPFVGLVHNDGGRGGLVVLTHHPKRISKSKRLVAEASKSGALMFGLVTGTIKGGVEVDVDGLRAFAPASHVELRPGSDLSHLVGKRLPFAVTQYAKRGRDVVLSRRAMLESEAKERREEALKKLEVGSVVDGIVRTVVPFGAFVDVGGVEGLVSLSEMSHNRADQPKDVFKVGEVEKVRILRIDDKGKLWLSRRAAMEDPWNQVAQKYTPGSRHTGKVARLQPFGAFIELEVGVDGLIHTADLSVKRIEHPEEVVKIGDDIDVVVASVDSHQHRIALHPAPTGDAANEVPQRVQLHKTVKVVVVGIETGGLAVRVLGATGRHARGFVSASATGTPRGTELRKLFPIGKELEVKVVEMDPRRGELKLSIKALNEETERNAYQQYRAQVKREAKFGTFADLLAKRNLPPTK